MWINLVNNFWKRPPTRILVLFNMVTPQETIDQELRDEVISEAQNYGKVLVWKWDDFLCEKFCFRVVKYVK